MAYVDLCRFIPTAGGTTDWVYSSAVGGCQSPSAANVIAGQTYRVYAVSGDLTQWEISTGINSAVTTFPRTTVLKNSSGTGTEPGQSGAGTKINFSTVPQVSVVAIAEDISPLLIPQGRLSATTGVSITTSDVTATTIYYTGGGYVPVYNGLYFVPQPFTELSLALDTTNTDTGYHQSGKVFDCFIFVDSSGAQKLGTGPAWTSSTARGTGSGTTELQTINGIWTNKNSIVLRFGNVTGNTTTISANLATYVGSFFTTADGTTKDSKSFRYLWNAYNQQPRPISITDPVNNFTYALAAWAYFNTSSANSVGILVGLDGAEVSARANAIAASNTSSATVGFTGIGLDGALANLAFSSYQSFTNAVFSGMFGFYEGFPGIGKHTIDWLMYGNVSPSILFFGTNTGTLPVSPGLTGTTWG